MDPNVALREMLSTANKIKEDYLDPESNGIDQEEAAALAQSVIDLNTWMVSGGFLPLQWSK